MQKTQKITDYRLLAILDYEVNHKGKSLNRVIGYYKRYYQGNKQILLKNTLNEFLGEQK